MISVRSAGFFGFASISAQTRWRCFDAASITTTGWFGSNARAMSSIGTIPVRPKAAFVSRPGTFVTIGSPGLKPSLRFHDDGSIGLPPAFFGIDRTLKFTRRFVSVVESPVVNQSFGNGNRQSAGSVKSQRSKSGEVL